MSIPYSNALSIKNILFTFAYLTLPGHAPIITNQRSMNATIVLIAHLQNLNNQKTGEINPRLQV